MRWCSIWWWSSIGVARASYAIGSRVRMIVQSRSEDGQPSAWMDVLASAAPRFRRAEIASWRPMGIDVGDKVELRLVFGGMNSSSATWILLLDEDRSLTRLTVDLYHDTQDVVGVVCEAAYSSPGAARDGENRVPPIELRYRWRWRGTHDTDAAAAAAAFVALVATVVLARIAYEDTVAEYDAMDHRGSVGTGATPG